MMKRLSPYILDEIGKENGELSQWAFNSHSWVEISPGYFECKWCGLTHYGSQGISKDFTICRENYCIKKLIYDFY